MSYLTVTKFNEAVALKRKGCFCEAGNIYIRAIVEMLQQRNVSELTDYLRPLAKVFYLGGYRDWASACYSAIMQHNVLSYPQIVSDCRNQSFQFVNFINQWAPEIGYCQHPKDINYYNAIYGKGGDYDPEKYIEDGYNFVLNEILYTGNNQKRLLELLEGICVNSPYSG